MPLEEIARGQGPLYERLKQVLEGALTRMANRLKVPLYIDPQELAKDSMERYIKEVREMWGEKYEREIFTLEE